MRQTTFSAPDKKRRMDAQEKAVRKEIEVLLHPSFREVSSHPNVTRQDLTYGTMEVPNSGVSCPMFFLFSPDLCVGGELFNYICPTKVSPAPVVLG